MEVVDCGIHDVLVWIFGIDIIPRLRYTVHARRSLALV